ncbi:DUF732 domain-containing protein [Mycobacterium simiae]|uniref:DUF732 domain-containing protein n=1 Tax=Mycobacterium simiae TaxID=1784 RepID=UPI0020CAA71A|nr:DUF732 domain-containing protein [Mycobacterium simiae]
MIRTLALLGIAALTTISGPLAHADPDGTGDSAFLATVRGAGIAFTDPDQAIASAKTVCELIGAGKPGPELVGDLIRNNPRLTTDQATRFVGISAKYYCPQQLTDTQASAR